MASGRILKVEMTVNFTPGDLVRARGREWVALPTPGDGLLALRPLSGNENDIVVLAPDLELTPVEAARFDLPDDARTTVQSKAALLADALRLTLRRGQVRSDPPHSLRLSLGRTSLSRCSWPFAFRSRVC